MNIRAWSLFRRYAQFCVVGGSGVVVDMGFLWLLASPSTLAWASWCRPDKRLPGVAQTRCFERIGYGEFGLEFREDYRARMRAKLREFDVFLLDYCLTCNHVHLLVEAKDKLQISGATSAISVGGFGSAVLAVGHDEP